MRDVKTWGRRIKMGVRGGTEAKEEHGIMQMTGWR